MAHPSITFEVDPQTYDLLRTMNESYFRDGIERQVERLLEDRIAKEYSRDEDGNYHRLGELVPQRGRQERRWRGDRKVNVRALRRIHPRT